jgi:hypothetical protein
MKIGAGGLVNAIDITADGTVVCRTDVGGGYIYNRSAPNPGNAGGTGVWQQLCTTTALASQSVLVSHPLTTGGLYEVRIAPSNTQVLYMAWIGRVWVSSNKGANWNLTGFVYDGNVDGNIGGPRNYRYKMAIDPASPDACIMVTPTNGAFETVNGTSTGTWTHLAGIANNDSNRIGIVAFDPSSGTTGGRTNVCYIAVSGTGLYKRTTPTGSFTLVAGAPSVQLSELSVASDGTVYIINTTTGHLYNLIGTTWTDITPPIFITQAQGAQSVTIHPTLPGTVYAWTYTLGANISTNANTASPTWTDGLFETGLPSNLVANDIPWLATLYHLFFSNGMYSPVFDTLDNTKMWVSDQQGVWQIQLPLVSPGTFISFSAGIEEVVAQAMIVPPGFPPLCLGQDVACVQQVTPGVKYPVTQSWPLSAFLSFGASADYASSNPAFVAAITDFQSVELSAYNTQGGAPGHWTQFPTYPTGVPNGGSIACATPTEWIWVPIGGPPWHTGDGGSTWVNLCTSLGLPTSGWQSSIYLTRKGVAADRVNIGTFYLQNSGSSPGTYVITSNGTASAYHANTIDLSFNSKIKTVPGNVGHLLFTSGPSGTYSEPATNWPHNQLFYYSHDGGTTWSDVSGLSSGAFVIREVWAFGFGKAGPGQTYPSIWIYGFVNAASGGVPGVWVSYDNAVTWTQVGSQHPTGVVDVVTIMEGDMSSYDRVYIGHNGTGWITYNPTT